MIRRRIADDRDGERAERGERDENRERDHASPASSRNHRQPVLTVKLAHLTSS